MGRGLKHHPLIIRIRKLEDVAYFPSLLLDFLWLFSGTALRDSIVSASWKKCQKKQGLCSELRPQRWPNKYSQTNFNEVDIRISWNMHKCVSVGSTMTCCSCFFTISLPPQTPIARVSFPPAPRPTSSSRTLARGFSSAPFSKSHSARPLLETPGAGPNCTEHVECRRAKTCRVSQEVPPLKSSLLGGWPGMTL